MPEKIASLCTCGCGEMVSQAGVLFRSGHRAPFRERMVTQANAGDAHAVETLERMGWLAPDPRGFGAEIEFFGVDQDTVLSSMRRAGFGELFYRDGVDHHTRDTWKLVRDRSVNSSGSGNDELGLELVSPPLHGDSGREQVARALLALRAEGAQVDKTCGLHIHHSANDLDVDAVRRLIFLYTNAQEAINQIIPRSRREGNRYCEPYGDHDIDNLLRGCGTIEGLAAFTSNRYRTINIQCYAQYKTVEFRQHGGTLDTHKVLNWLAFGQAMIRRAQNTTISWTERKPATLEEVTSTMWLTGEQKTYFTKRAAYFRLHSERHD